MQNYVRNEDESWENKNHLITRYEENAIIKVKIIKKTRLLKKIVKEKAVWSSRKNLTVNKSWISSLN